MAEETVEGKDVIDLVRIEPSRENALFALAVSADLLVSAKERLGQSDFGGALEDSRNCIRMAASAVLFSDGFVAGSLDASLYHLEKNYSGIFPLEDWRIIEKMGPQDPGGLLGGVAKTLGLEKKPASFGTGESDASTAIGIAEKFVLSARYLFESRIESEMQESGETTTEG